MTSKEKLFKEYVEIHNSYCDLCGNKEDRLQDSDEYFASRQFVATAGSYSKAELQRKIDYAKANLERKKDELMVEAFFNTEDGRKRKKELESAKEEYTALRRDFLLLSQKRTNVFIKEWLGDEWGCNVEFSSYYHNIEIGLVKEPDEYRNGFVFGHHFDVTLNDFKTLRMNYGTMGYFNIDTDSLRTKYIIGMGKFLADTERLEKLKAMMIDIAKNLGKLEKTLTDITTELKNPFKRLFNR